MLLILRPKYWIFSLRKFTLLSFWPKVQRPIKITLLRWAQKNYHFTTPISCHCYSNLLGFLRGSSTVKFKFMWIVKVLREGEDLSWLHFYSMGKWLRCASGSRRWDLRKDRCDFVISSLFTQNKSWRFINTPAFYGFKEVISNRKRKKC